MDVKANDDTKFYIDEKAGRIRVDYNCSACEGIGRPTKEHLQYHEIESLKEQLDNYKQVLTEALMISTTPELKRFKRKATKLLNAQTFNPTKGG